MRNKVEERGEYKNTYGTCIVRVKTNTLDYIRDNIVENCTRYQAEFWYKAVSEISFVDLLRAFWKRRTFGESL